MDIVFMRNKKVVGTVEMFAIPNVGENIIIDDEPFTVAKRVWLLQGRHPALGDPVVSVKLYIENVLSEDELSVW